MIARFKNGLVRSKSGFLGQLQQLFKEGELSDSFFEELEEILVSGDVGIQTSIKLVDRVKQEAVRLRLRNRDQVRDLLARHLTELLEKDVYMPESGAPLVILLVGVNGSGKTTSAAKLAGNYHSQGRRVLLVAGDTFRAAAVEQLEIWSEKAGVDLIKQQSGSDPSALFFDAINAARSRSIDVLIGDTAGRLHNKYNLMEELKKIYRVIGHTMEGAPHQVLLVVDATTGQNALAQAASFNEALPLNGLILTKLDGTARGGIIFSISDNLNIPVCYVGTGEGIDDLLAFDAAEFVEAFLDLQ